MHYADQADPISPRCQRPNSGQAPLDRNRAPHGHHVHSLADVVCYLQQARNTSLLVALYQPFDDQSVPRLQNAQDQICAMPPSTKSSMPFTKLLSSDARKTTTLAISSGVPTRPSGMVVTCKSTNAWTCSFVSPIRS
jgi:hypothetical protein